MGNMVKAAAESKRVNPKTVIEDNEKYYLRSWLLRVGFDGADGKDGRRVLLEGLKATRPSVRPTTRPSGKLPEPQPVSARRPNRRPLLPLLRGSCFRL